MSDFTSGTLQVLAAQAGFDVNSCDETVKALLTKSDDISKPWSKSPKDTVDNVLQIETIYSKK